MVVPAIRLRPNRKEAFMKMISSRRLRYRPTVRRAAWLSAAILFGSLPALSQDRLPEGDGKATIQRVCGSCHGLNQATNRKMARADWEWTLDRMLGYGAPIKKDEV